MSISAKYHVNFFDTDAMAVVHHAKYIRWFEIGRVEYLRQIGISLEEMMDDGFVFPITSIEAKYLHSGKYDDDLIIETTATVLNKIKMEFDYRIIRSADNAVLVTGHSQNVFTDRNTGKITRLPAKYFERLETAMQKELAAKEGKKE